MPAVDYSAMAELVDGGDCAASIDWGCSSVDVAAC